MNSRRVKIAQRPNLYSRGSFNSGNRPSQGQGSGLAKRLHLGLVPRRLLWLVIVIGVGLWALWANFAVTDVTVTGTDQADQLATQVRAQLQAHLGQGNLLTLNQQQLEQDITKANPLIKTIVVKRHYPHALSVAVTLKQPSLGWVSGNSTYLLDRDGSIIGPLNGAATVPVVLDGSNLPVQVGQRVTTARFVTFTTAINQALPSLKLAATQYQVRDTTLDLYVSTNKGYRLILDTGRDANEQVASLKILLAYLASQKKAPAEYIDLRITGKAYYK